MSSLPQPLQLTTSAAITLGIFALPCWLFGQYNVTLEAPTLLPAPERVATYVPMVQPTDDGRTPDAAADASDEGATDGSGAPAQEPAEAPPEPSPPEPVSEPAEAPPEAVADAPAADDAAPMSRKPLPGLMGQRRVALRARLAADVASGRVVKRVPKRKRQCLEGDNPEIEETRPGEFRVSRALVDHYTDDLREASRLASVAWHQDDDGKRDGFRIRRIRCGSVLHEAGLRNGDVVHRVNGRPVRNIPQALAAYRKLRKKRKLRLDVTRKGESIDLRYTLS